MDEASSICCLSICSGVDLWMSFTKLGCRFYHVLRIVPQTEAHNRFFAFRLGRGVKQSALLCGLPIWSRRGVHRPDGVSQILPHAQAWDTLREVVVQNTFGCVPVWSWRVLVSPICPISSRLDAEGPVRQKFVRYVSSGPVNSRRLLSIVFTRPLCMNGELMP